MKDSLRYMVFLFALAMTIGCGGSPKEMSMDTRTYHGAFNMIVSEVENLQQQVNAESYKVQYNPIEDQVGSAIHAFMTNKEVVGTPLETEAKKLADKEAEILKIWRSPGATVEKIRTAAKEMMEQVEHMKTLI
jgi:hypothetical protein